MIPPLGDLAGAIAGGTFVLFAMMIGSAIGEQIAGFLFGKVKGGVLQIVYMLFFMPVFIIGGYAYSLLNIPQTSLVASALFFGLWGIFAVCVSRLFISFLGKVLGIRILPKKKSYINGKELIKRLKEKKLPDNEVRSMLTGSCESKRNADRLFEGGSEWVDIDPEALCYQLSKKGFSVHEVMEILTKVLRMKPEDAAVVWKNASV
ncbi:MAG: hypothetical protein JW724_03070 [Candidatus Altiarchaeota archaeon]|nr:hypothetical protein [Candidatus Altiarchaeota archaeon]